eukprot:CAMPEP_0184863130 /NCGR_PEP_ID=MMETSP0580-20130426/9102_1 /TAXON_ID=1118495 /ORGANISM="Dactyliosolen fragilissimus" /LENGTH=321 /DNA_ID=CAMNT_0027361243 /DNA_START=124 /DNA_END=1089 /DNA_ORIENTATION=+
MTGSRLLLCHSSIGRAKKHSSARWIKRHESDPYVKRARKEGSPSRAMYKLEEIERMIKDKAKKFGARAANRKRGTSYKTILQNKTSLWNLFQPGNTVIDLGAAPGGWSLYASEQIGRHGTLIAVDLLDLDRNTIDSLSNDSERARTKIFRGDFNDPILKEEIVTFCTLSPKKQMNRENLTDVSFFPNGEGVDCVISDMAANFTGDRRTDAIRTINLCEKALAFSIGSSCFSNNDIIHDPMFEPRSNHVDMKNWQERGLLRVGGKFLCKLFSCGKENEKDLISATKMHFDFSFTLKPHASRNESSELYLFATGFKGNHHSNQ